MTFRPLLLAALTLGLTSGCSERQNPPTPSATNEPGTAAQAPARPEQPAQPPSEPGSGGATGEAAQGPQQPQEGAVAVYEVRISGVRCIAAPCPTHTAQPVSPPGADAVQIHEVDFSALNLPAERVEALNRRMDEGSVKVEARIGTRPKAGPAGAATVLRVTKVIDPQP